MALDDQYMGVYEPSDRMPMPEQIKLFTEGLRSILTRIDEIADAAKNGELTEEQSGELVALMALVGTTVDHNGQVIGGYHMNKRIARLRAARMN